MAKKVTIKDIADMAGVSIATVSHVINRTRYVSPDLVEKIENIIIETGYHKKIEEKERRLKVGRQSEIVAVIPNVESTIYRDMVGYLKKYVSIQGYQFYIAITDNDIKEEAQVLEGLIQNKKTAGIIHVPVSDVAADYKKLIESGIPFVCMERNILGDGIDAVEFRDREAIFKGTDYLLECGHKNILFLRESLKSTTRDERTRGFLLALEEHGINTNDANISDINIESGAENCILEIQKAMRRYMPTAIMAGGNRITLYLMKTMRDKMFIAIGTGYLFNVIPLPVVYMVILIAIFSFLLSKTKFGTYVYAIGGNREAARLSGVPIKKIEIIVFTLSGALAAFAGLVLCSRMYSGQPSVGSGYELDAIAACVLGGTSMTGGKGRISGTVFGAMVIGIISNGLNLIGVSSYWQLIIKGLIIACAVLLDCQKDKIALLKNKVRAAK